MPQCSGEGAPGDECETGEDCASGVCLSGLRCPDTEERISICAGDRCGDGCADDERCVSPFGLSNDYCYPISACLTDEDGGDMGQPGDASTYDGEEG